jgi:lysyl-tRNA synthetase class 1
MFWSDKVAQNLEKRNLPLKWVYDMKTPSGKIHVGSLHGVVVHDPIYKALQDAKVKTKYTYIFDNHDHMDDLPAYLDQEKLSQYLGMPLYKIPSPVEGFAIMKNSIQKILSMSLRQSVVIQKFSGQQTYT